MTGDVQSDAGREVRTLEASDAFATAALHARELPDGFFAQLGPRFLRAYHCSFVESPHAVALVACRDGGIEGFLLGVLAPGPHGAHVLRRCGFGLAWRAVLALLVRPRLLVLFLRTRLLRYARGIWRRRRASPDVPPTATGHWAVLSHVAVDGAHRGAGAGAALVRSLHARVEAVGASGVVLLTAVNGPGTAFYRGLGYVEEGQVVGADGQQWIRYRWRLPDG